MNQPLRQVWPIFFLSLPLTILLLVGWQLSRFAASQPPRLPGGEEEGSTIQQLQLWHHQGTRLVWTLQAPLAITHGDGSVDVEQPNLVFNGEKGGQTRLQAGRGWLSERGDLATFRQNVSVDDDKNRRLTTQGLRYQPELGILSSAEPFQWQDNGLTLQGVGFQVNQKDRKLRVAQGVRSTFSGPWLPER